MGPEAAPDEIDNAEFIVKVAFVDVFVGVKKELESRMGDVSAIESQEVVHCVVSAEVDSRARQIVAVEGSRHGFSWWLNL